MRAGQAFIAGFLALLGGVVFLLLLRSWWRSRRPGWSGLDIAPELARAVRLLSDGFALCELWQNTNLGSCERGWPVPDEWDTTRVGLRVPVHMLVGQATKDWQAHTDEFAHFFGVDHVTVCEARHGVLVLELRVFDPFAEPLDAIVPVETIDLEGVPVGKTESGEWWFLPVLYRHLLIVGATGAGKGGVVWSLLAGLAPAVRDGYVSVRVGDPKGGMEFGAGHAMFDTFAYTVEDLLAMMRDSVTEMQERAERLRASGCRKHVPTVQEPLVVIVLDELAAMTAYVPDTKVRKEIEQLMGLLLTQGRAVGYSVIGCVQDPSKEVVALRQLFPLRVCLRLKEASQVAMVLGQGARDRGALCDVIPESTPGVGYVDEDGVAELVRVRAFHLTDTGIGWLAANYPRPTGQGEDVDGTTGLEAA